VINGFRVERFDERDVIRDLGGVRHQFADPSARFTVLRELKTRRHYRKRRLGGGHAREPLATANGLRQFAALEFVQSRLEIEQLHLGRPAGLEQVNDALGFGSEMRKVR
jgi:hypothetical protein